MSLQMLINAILLGGLYALMGIGFSLQWGISGIINLSYGAMVVLGSYLSLIIFNMFNIDPFISMFFSGFLLFLLGAFVYKFTLQPSIKGGIVFTLIITFAVRLIVENIILLVWSADYRTIRLSYAGSNFQFLGTFVPLTKFLTFLLAGAIIYLTYQFMMNTKIGKGIQAVALDKEGALAVGVDDQKMYLINFALGTALAGVTGSLWASIYSFSPHVMDVIIGKVFIIAILGGLGNIWGAAAGGILLGFAETSGATFLGSQWQEAIGLVIMVLILLFRPHGLIGKKFFG
ncbi:MAG: branched-chain amino acid ABC transporter permease [Atribacterota bacterium]|jgi:branched-chain amino acid transport system permease protein|nr:branched-chain amino acid ABC transporter permease [Atribacterota bacterium]MDD4895447.1 branched-chain amino acid ABC transporter permease [Atribacterota bacterium]MDD5637624.1 branched-chain amino acid ABC transporter permease [Atribacterota bacterium]